MRKDWIKASDTTTEEFMITANGGKALMHAKDFYEMREFFTAFIIVKGLGLNVYSAFDYEFITGTREITDDKGNKRMEDTIYAKLK